MTVLSAQSIWLRRPIKDMQNRTTHNGMTYGMSSCGYDCRVAENVKLGLGMASFMLASTMEEFDMPIDLVGIVHDKSSWARKGVAVQNTVIEPYWKGFLTLELTNHSSSVISIPAGSPICQIVFHKLDEPTILPYQGKYQHQKAGPQPAIDEGPHPSITER